MGIRIKDIPAYCGAELYGVNALSSRCARFVTDSRNVKNGDVFIAIKGERHDAHDFIDEKLEQNAAIIIVNKEWFKISKKMAGRYAVVEDTVLAMLRMAKVHLQSLAIPVVAITGSNGKTTTRTMVTAVLSARYNVHSTAGNFNNRIGLPLTVFNAGKKHDIIVLEMGTNHFGEISELSKCALPETAVITNIGNSHLEFLHDRKGVLKAKLEIADGLRENGTLILNGDDELLFNCKTSKPIDLKYAGFDNGRYLKGSKLKTSLVHGTSFNVGRTVVNLKIPGKGAAVDALLAMAVGKLYGVPVSESAKKLSLLAAPENRMETKTMNGAVIISDCYNANPDSVLNLLDLLGSDTGFKRRIAVLGTMGELGKSSAEYHRAIGRKVVASGIDILLTVGDGGREIANGAIKAGLGNVFMFAKAEDVAPVIRSSARHGDVLLVKGSHSVHLERIIEMLKSGSKNIKEKK